MEHNYNKTILGQNTFIDFEPGGNNNVIVFGSSGTGKSFSFVEPNLLQMNSSFIVADAKGTILNHTGDALSKKGYKVKVLNLVDLEKSMCYNPLKYVETDEEIMSLSDMIVRTNIDGSVSSAAKGKDPFWDTSARVLLESLIGYIIRYTSDNCHIMDSVSKLFTNLNLDKYNDNYDSAVDNIFKEIEEIDPDSIVLQNYKAVMQASEKALRSVCMSLGVMLGPWMNSAIKRIVSNDELNLDKIGFEKTAIFVIYDDTDPSKNFLSNILYSQIIRIALKNSQKCKNQMLPIPVRFFLDDFLSIEIPNFPTIIANCRSRNISICMMLQDESQLEHKYGDLYKSVIGNCSTYVLTGTTDLSMARRASDRFGIKPENIRALDSNKFLIDYSGEIIEDFRYDPRQHPNYTFYNYDVNEDSNIDLDRYESFIKKDQENKPSLIEKMTSYIKSKQSTKNFVANVKNNPTDSYTEKLFFDEFKNFFDPKMLQLETQVHLNSIFSISGSKDIQVKASLMSVDFLIRDKDDYNPLFAIEIDGPQHNRDTKQIENDEIKNMFFKQSGVTLVRIPANFVYYQNKKGLWNTSDNWVIPLLNELNAVEGYNKKINKFLSDFLTHMINNKVYFYKNLCGFRKSRVREYIPKDFHPKTSKSMLLKIEKYSYLDNILLMEKDDDVFASNRDDDIISSPEEIRCDNSIDLDDIDSWGVSTLVLQTPSEDYYKQRKRLENILKYKGNPGIRKIIYESYKCKK